MSPSRTRGHWFVAYAFVVVMASSTVPSPLFRLYAERDGFASWVGTVIYAMYAVGVIAALFLAGHLSDWYGRRRVLLAAIAVTIASTVLFVVSQALPVLLVARVINGLGVGVVTATATAYLMELFPGSNRRRAALIAVAVNLGGLGLGALLAGVIAEWGGHALTLPYLVVLGGLLVAFAAVARAPETVDRPDPAPSYRPQRVAVPEESRGSFAAAATGMFLAFASQGLFTGLAGTFLALLGHSSPALAGVTVCLMFMAGVAAQIGTVTWPVRQALVLGLVLEVVGLGATVTATWLASPSLALFMAGGACAGAGAGVLVKAMIGTAAMLAPPESRAEVLAGLFLAGYIGLSFPAVGAGIALEVTSARTTILVFAAIVLAGLLAAVPRLLASRALRRAPQPA